MTVDGPRNARQWRHRMVDEIDRDEGVSAATAEAMRRVERHLFTGDVPLEHAYDAFSPVVTKRDDTNVAVSSASAPSLVAGMLDQLKVSTGHRVMEIGAGTGYNAALLAEIVGDGGQVTAVEIDPEVAAQAEANLKAAGSRVTVACGDGEYGWPQQAPYDRIIVTAGAWDIPQSWTEQLAPDGLLVVPLRIRGVTRSITFARQHGVWVSTDAFECGFMAMRGDGAMTERQVKIRESLVLRIDDNGTAGAHSLAQAITEPATTVWTSITTAHGRVENLDLCMASINGFCRIIALPGHADAGVMRPVYGWGSMGAARHDSLAYVTKRRQSPTDPWQLGACAYGPQAAALADEVAERIHTWAAHDLAHANIRVEAHPAYHGDTTNALLTAEKGHTRVIVRPE